MQRSVIKEVPLPPLVLCNNAISGLYHKESNQFKNQYDENVMNKTVAVIGSGYVGMQVAVIFAKSGFDVIA